jgi:3-oxoacyl-[acyl-carrier protein] reductase
VLSSFWKTQEGNCPAAFFIRLATHSCASAFVREGFTVNAIAPALIETDMVARNPNASPNLIPMGHFGSVDDVASVAVMLAMNEYMTGQTLSVNGGWYMS